MESYTHTGFSATLTLLEKGGVTPRFRLSLVFSPELEEFGGLLLPITAVTFQAVRETAGVFDLSWPNLRVFEFSIRLDRPIRNPRGFLRSQLYKLVVSRSLTQAKYHNLKAVLALVKQLETEGLLPPEFIR